MNKKEFIKNYVEKITSEGIKHFPADFLTSNNLKIITMPGKPFHIGEEFFGSYEILNSEGESFLHVKNYMQAKYLIYSNRDLPTEIFMPVDEEEVNKSVKSYESYLDKIIKEINSALLKTSVEIRNSSNVINGIFRILNLVRY